MNVPLYEKLIQRQINQWNRYREVLGSAYAERPVAPRPIITISRQLGSGGRQLAEQLATHLDLQVHGQDIVDHVAGDRNLERRVVEELDEQMQSQIDLWVKGVLNQRIFMRDEFHVALVRIIRTLAAHGGVVVLGRGGNFVLADTCSLRVRLVADLETRIANLSATQDLTVEQARQRIDVSDAGRARFIEQLYHARIDNPVHYDVVINTGTVDRTVLLEFVLQALEMREAARGAPAGKTAPLVSEAEA